jgi:hypothetical protein
LPRFSFILKIAFVHSSIVISPSHFSLSLLLSLLRTFVFSRVKWIEEGEKNTAYFLGLEKTRQTKMAKNELYDKNGKSTTDQTEIIFVSLISVPSHS